MHWMLDLPKIGSIGDKIVVKDNNGNIIIEHTTTKSYSAAIISSPLLKKGSSYAIYVDDTLISEFTISSTITTVGNIQGNMNPGGGRWYATATARKRPRWE